MAARKHTHKYHRVSTGVLQVWACALPDCTHYMPKHMENMLPGKNTVCWSCDTETILTPINMSQDQPMCPVCMGIEKVDDGMAARIRKMLENSDEPLSSH